MTAMARKTTAKKRPVKKAATRKSAAGRRSAAAVVSGPGIGETYRAKRGEDYMNEEQLTHFRDKLLAWKEEILRDLNDTMSHLKEDITHLADPNDRATQESEFALE